MRVSDAYPSSYIKAADLNGRPTTLTMDKIAMESMGRDQDDKPVLYFSDAKKGLVLNVTNARTISDAFGDEMDNWHGHQIELFPTRVDFQGRQTDAVRVRPVIPRVTQASQASADDGPPWEKGEQPPPPTDPQAPLDDPIDL